MNKEFLKMQKIAGLITENQMKAIIGDIDDTPSPDGDFNPMDYADSDGGEMASLDQGIYMDFLNNLFNALGNGADAYSDSTWTEKEKELEGAIGRAISAAGIDLV